MATWLEKVKNDKNAAVDFNKNKPTNTAGKTIGENISQTILNDAKDRQRKIVIFWGPLGNLKYSFGYSGYHYFLFYFSNI